MANQNLKSLVTVLLSYAVNPSYPKVHFTRRLSKLASELDHCRTASPQLGPRVQKGGSSSKKESPQLKTPKSAVVVMPPTWDWDDIQELRKFHDKGFYRWMPHINLLYPFYEDSTNNFEDAISRLEMACRAIEPFKVSLSSFDFFVHGQKTSTIWLKPESPGSKRKLNDAPLNRLHHALVEACPDCDDLSNDKERSITEFSPHLSVGQWRGKKDAVEAIHELKRKWSPVEFTVDAIYIISRPNFRSPFGVRWKIPLGSTGKKELINQKYFAVNQGTGGRDEWKFARKERPAADQKAKDDIGLLPWGLSHM